MSGRPWSDVINGGRWASGLPLWVEDGCEYSWRQVSAVADRIREQIPPQSRVVQVSAGSKVGYFAAQLAVWRLGRIFVTDDGSLSAEQNGRVGADTVVSVPSDVEARIDYDQIRKPAPDEAHFPTGIAAVNFTSGSTGARKAVAVTAKNLLATWADPSLSTARVGHASASFAQPAFDGWWFDTWRTVTEGGTVVCLPGVNDDVFAWPDLARRYNIGRVLLPAAVLSTLLDAAPECLVGFPTIFSGGEAFGTTVVSRAAEAGLSGRFVNLYGPTEATFATHRYDVGQGDADGPIPIGRPLSSVQQLLRPLDDQPEHFELVVKGPTVCAGYLDDGRLTTRFLDQDGHPSYSTGDLVTVAPTGDLVFVGRRDRQVKVNGHRIDAGQLERHVLTVPGVSACRLLQRDHVTVAFVVLLDRQPHARTPTDDLLNVVRSYSAAIHVQLVDNLPLRGGGKVDEGALFETYNTTV